VLDNWTDFFVPYFPQRAEVDAFVRRCEELEGPHPAKIMMHQTQRLISLADDVANLPSGTDGLRLLFFIVCAENIAKLHDDFTDEGYSKRYVRRFFEEFVDDDDKKLLQSRCVSLDFSPLTLTNIVDGLYQVRCDVVHEGRYWGFSFSTDGSHTASGNSPFWTQLSAKDRRDAIIRGCMRAIVERLPSGGGSRAA
jgi:hypothetical protein